MTCTIRKADLKDRDGIIELLRQSFSGYWTATQSTYSPEFWDWLYKDNTGGGSITFVAEGNGKIVAHFPNVLGLLKVKEESYLAGTVLHLTTHSDYRRKGIFKDMGRRALKELAASNIPFSLAFPNDASRPGFTTRLGFTEIATLPLLVRPLRMKNILNTVVKRPFLAELASFMAQPLYSTLFYDRISRRENKDIKIKIVNEFGPDFDSFWEQAMPQAKVMLKRDSRFLNWRFKLRPGEKHNIITALKNNKLVGYIVTRKADIFSLQAGIIMDYLILPGEARVFQALVGAALDNFKAEGADICITACLPGNIYYKTLGGAGFVVIPSRFNPRKLVLVGRVNQDGLDEKTFIDKRNWFLSFADWDVF